MSGTWSPANGSLDFQTVQRTDASGQLTPSQVVGAVYDQIAMCCGFGDAEDAHNLHRRGIAGLAATWDRRRGVELGATGHPPPALSTQKELRS